MTRATVAFLPPAEPLRPLVTAYYRVGHPGGEGTIEDLLHPEWGNLRFALVGHWAIEVDRRLLDPGPAIGLYGPTSRAGIIRVPAGGRGMGVGLTPLGWAVLTGLEAHAWADRASEVAAVRGADLAGLAAVADGLDDAALIAAFDRLFLSILATPEAREDLERAPLIGRAHRALLDPDIGTVEAFAEALGVSPRQASRLSLKAFGFAPKLLLRRQRFLRTLAVLRQNLEQPWATQLDGHYYDQPHFVRDFRRFMDMSPSAYFALPRDLLEPAALARQSALGQPLQGLHAAPAPVSDLSKS